MQQGNRRSQLKLHTPKRATNFANWYIVRKALHSEEIEEVKELVSSIGLTTATTVGNKEGYRDSYIKWLPDCDTSEYKWLYNRIWKWAKIANDENWGFELAGWKDCLQYTFYDSPSGHYDWHTDFGGPSIDHRKVSSTILLTKPEEGGELLFRCGNEDVPIHLDIGDAVFFPSWVNHKVADVTSGTRESIVSWISGQPFR